MEPRSKTKLLVFNTLKQYVGFDEQSTAALRELRPFVAPRFPGIVDDFYRTIVEHPDARAAVTGGDSQITRLKVTLTHWLDTLLAGPHDEAYFESRARIGHVHVRIDLPQAYMFTAMNRIRIQLLDLVERVGLAPDRRRRAATAVQQILDLDLAIMLETYREDLLAKNRTAERLATIGQLAAGVGHELRHPLGVVDSSAFLLRQRLDARGLLSPDLGKHLDRISSEIKRAANTISDLLALAASHPPRRQCARVGSVIEAATEAALLPATITVDVSMPADLTGDFDPDQIRHVLSNLLTNANQAMQGTGTVRITAGEHSSALEVRVLDDGPGVPEPIRRRIFEPLFTTKAQGSGIGLALCRRIIEAHRGTLDLEPSDKGATFVVRIPRNN
jgi:signal transduction histidine kinase